MKLFELKKQAENRKSEARKQARTRLKKLRVQLADDTDVDANEVAEIMQAAGVDFEELERQVAMLKRRRALLAQIERGKSEVARAAKIDEEIQEAEDAFAPTLQKHQQQVARLRAEQSDLTESYKLISIENSLRSGATCPNLAAAKERLASQRKELVRQQRGLEHQQTHHKSSAKVLKAEIARQRSMGATPPPRLAEEIAVHESKAAGFEQELSSINEAIGELEFQLEELRERELDPNCF
ncbi:hypothetical protein [Fuerstiella marisgermanici]|uniref:Uncharacterized protein n=1 Tax=Fuerstiella marisgermanici TaxID=1891926 RepID=A0A1P8WSA7_9PLAN|nr:hypothetical protein [Fuerstiella marisgermanici]APZ96929.1 hypothetical protein Fuma_06605 [Fuerstiella marisgermanici]